MNDVKTKINVSNVAKLANLPVSGEEAEKLEGQLEETLKFIENLDEVDTSKVDPTNSVTGLSNVMRSDETEPSIPQDEALKNASSKEAGYFKVKAIFDES